VIADGLRDPGNLGTLLRSVAAAGADYLAIADASVDAFNSKVVRSGMGAHFHLPVYQARNEQLQDVLAGVAQVVIAEADGNISYDEINFTRSTVIVIGGEADGPLGAIEYPRAVRVRIPLARQVESLNAGVAGSLLIFEAARQRRIATSRNA
jgi:TrmH family RNA methyltransferase